MRAWIGGFLAVGMALLTGCGGGDGGDGSSDFTYTPSGFPQVAGRYSLNTGTWTWTTMGQSGSFGPTALTLDISQVDNHLTGVNPYLDLQSGDQYMGFTLREESGVSGNVQKDGNFTITSSLRGSMDGVGEVRVDYTLVGSFTSSGWSGTYTYMVIGGEDVVTYSTTFTGERI